MILFCPTCGNLLLLENGTQGNTFFCQTCPYLCPVKAAFTDKTVLERKRMDDVLGGADAWKNVDATDSTCPKCEHTRAYFMQIQLRSADEPSSLFYRCCNPSCNHQWREG